MAKSDIQLVAELSLQNEQSLLSNNTVIHSTWFENTCMQLANKMQFDYIIQCKLFKSEHMNAYVLANGHVYFSSAMMLQIKNKHQWASILAHESAHLELEHYLKTLKAIQKPSFFFPKSKIKKMMRKHEKQADDWSKKQLIKFGFDHEQIFFFLQRVIQLTGDKKANGHLKPSARIKNNNKSELIDGNIMGNIVNIFQQQ